MGDEGDLGVSEGERDGGGERWAGRGGGETGGGEEEGDGGVFGGVSARERERERWTRRSS